MQDHAPSFTKGNPRNIALIGHWDGWQPFGYPGSHRMQNVAPLLFQALLISVLQLYSIR